MAPAPPYREFGEGRVRRIVMTQSKEPQGLSDGERDKRELDTILSSLTSILILVDSDFAIQRWNPAAERAFGLAAEQVIGHRLSECGVQWDEDDLRRMTANIAMGSAPPGFKLGFESADGLAIMLGVSLSPIHSDSGGASRTLILAHDITESRKTEEMQRRLTTAVEQVDDTIVITDLHGTIIYANPAFERVSGYTREEAMGATPAVLKSGKQDQGFYDDLWTTLGRGEVWSGHFTNRKKDGTLYEEDATISPVRDEAGHITNFVAVKKDVTERMALEIQLRTAQKLESIGQLAAGIAHEINTPTQFISDNTRFLRDSFADLTPLLNAFRRLCEPGTLGRDPAKTLDELVTAAQGVGLDFICEEIPGAIEESLTGLNRVSEIVSAMKSFSHPGVSHKQPIDLNESIRTTVTLSTNEWKYVAKVNVELDPELPPVNCLPGEIGQVILNILVNAAHAVAEANVGSTGTLGEITVTTQSVGDTAEIRISDDGCGMPQDVANRIFDPFYTTKEVGRGTGQGLAIAHSVVDKHSGTIEVDTEPGKGTTFVIRIPFHDPEGEVQAA